MNDTLILKRIADLEKEVASLKRSSTIPRNVEVAFRQRLGDIKNTPVTASTTAFNLTGDPQTINVAQPTATIPIIIDGVTYKLFYQ